MSRGKSPAFQLYANDWLSDFELRSCSAASRGIFIDLMCLMHKSETYGKLLINGSRIEDKQVINMLKVHHKTYHRAIKELLDYGVLKVDDEGVYYSARMLKDHALREQARENGKTGGNPILIQQGVNPPLKPSSSSSSSSTSSSGKPPISPLVNFAQFWNAYPRKKSKGQAEKTWKKLKVSDELLKIILTGIEKAKLSHEWMKDNGNYIPYPATWLNAKGWEDEHKPYRPTTTGAKPTPEPSKDLSDWGEL